MTAGKIGVNQADLAATSGSYIVLTVGGKKRDVIAVDNDDAALVVRAFDPENPGQVEPTERIAYGDITAAQQGVYPEQQEDE